MGRHSHYRPEYCDEVVEFLSRGHSVAAFAGRVGVSRSTVYEWIDTHEDFAEAYRVGRAKALLAWEELALNAARTGVGSASVIIFGLKNRARDEWSDESTLGLSGGLKTLAVSIVAAEAKTSAE